jgi:hypothetical protein
LQSNDRLGLGEERALGPVVRVFDHELVVGGSLAFERSDARVVDAEAGREPRLGPHLGGLAEQGVASAPLPRDLVASRRRTGGEDVVELFDPGAYFAERRRSADVRDLRGAWCQV